MVHRKSEKNRRRLGIEQLDQRICMSFQTFFDDGVLSIIGTRGDDAVTIVDNGLGTILVDTGNSNSGGVREVQQITVLGLGGNDIVRYLRLAGPSSIAPIRFDLGDGNDSLDILAIPPVEPTSPRDPTAPSDPSTPSIPSFDITAGEGDDSILIGLLVPAVQKVREAAARIHVDLGAGNDLLQMNSSGIERLDLDLSAGTGDDGVLIGLLLPAVQKVREAAARANVDLGGGNDFFRMNSNGIDQLDLDLSAGRGDDSILIGMLLPAVQKVRDAASRAHVDLGFGNDLFQLNTDGVDRFDLDLTSGGGDDSVLIGLLLPAVQKVREAAARINVDLGAGNDVLRANTDGFDQLDLNLTAGAGNDAILIGMLLPAVQKVRDAAARASVDLGLGHDIFQLNSDGVDQLDLDLSAGGGEDAVLIGLLLPAVQKVRAAAARMSVDLGAGNDQFIMNGQGVDLVDLALTAGNGDDTALIGLLLPAVQKVRESAARMSIDLGTGSDRLVVRTAGYDLVDVALTGRRGRDVIIDVISY